jgi:hypothetical protein
MPLKARCRRRITPVSTAGSTLRADAPRHRRQRTQHHVDWMLGRWVRPTCVRWVALECGCLCVPRSVACHRACSDLPVPARSPPSFTSFDSAPTRRSDIDAGVGRCRLSRQYGTVSGNRTKALWG